MIGKVMEIIIITLKHRNLNQAVKHSIISTINSQILREANNSKLLLLLFNLNKKYLLQLISLSSLSEDNPTSNHLNHSHNSLLSYLLRKLKVHLMPLELQMQRMEGRKVQILFRISSNKAVVISLQTQVANKTIKQLLITQAILLITLDNNNQSKRTYLSNKKFLHNSRLFSSSNLQQYNL